MTTIKPFLIPNVLVTASCLAALIYGCGGCTAENASAGDEIVSSSSSETSDLESMIPDMLADMGETGQDPDHGAPLSQPEPDRPMPTDVCTALVDACCWCTMDDRLCVFGIDMLACSDVGGTMVPGCIMVVFPPSTVDAPQCSFECA